MARSRPRGPARPGEVRIGDRNFANAKALAGFRAQSQGQADFVVRAGWKAFALSRRNGSAFDLIGHLQALPRDDQPHEVEVRAKLGKTGCLPLRLVILRQSAETTEHIRN